MGFRGPGELTSQQIIKLTPEERDEALKAAFPTTGEVLSAAYELSNMDSSLEALGRFAELSVINEEDDELLPPEQLNARFPGMPIPFTEPKSEAVAASLYERHKRRLELGQVISRAEDSVMTTVGAFGASLLPHMIDPVNLAADLTVGGAVLGLGRMVTGGKAVLASRNAGTVLARGATEGVIGNLATEPLTQSLNEIEQQDYTAAQSFVNVVAGGVFFPAVRFGIHKGSSFVRGLGGQHPDVVAKAAIVQAASGRRVNVDPLVRDFAQEMGGVPRWAPEYQFRHLSEGVRGRQFYAAGKGSVPELRDSLRFEEDFGDGVYITDHPGVANGAAARKLDSRSGGITRVELDDARLIDLDQPLSPEARAALEPVIKDVLAKQKLKELDLKSGRELFDDVRAAIEGGKAGDDLVERMNQALKGAGFDGYHYEGGRLGAEQHNALMLFDPDRLRENAKIRPDREAVRKPTTQELQQTLDEAQSFRSERTFDDATFKEFEELRSREFKSELDANDINRKANELFEELDALGEQGILGEAELKELSEIKAMKKEQTLRDRLVKAATFCVGLG